MVVVFVSGICGIRRRGAVLWLSDQRLSSPHHPAAPSYRESHSGQTHCYTNGCQKPLSSEATICFHCFAIEMINLTKNGSVWWAKMWSESRAGLTERLSLSLCVVLQTWIHVLVLLLSGVSYFGFVLLFSLFCVTCSPPTNPLGVETLQTSQPLFYFVCAITTVMALLPRYTHTPTHLKYT